MKYCFIAFFFSALFYTFKTNAQTPAPFLPGKVDVSIWSPQQQLWQYSNTERYAYNSAGQVIRKAITNANGDSLMKEIFAFDAFGNKTGYGFYTKVNGAWKLGAGNRYTLTYDAVHPSKPATRIDERFVQGNWETDGKFIFEYHSNGHFSKRTNEVFINGNWVPAARILVHYDAAGVMQNAYLQFTNATGKWINDDRIINPAGFLSEDESTLTAYTMQDTVNGAWINTDKQEITTIDANGSSRTIWQQWQNNQWVFKRRTIDSLNTKGRIIASSREDFTNGAWAFAERGRIKTTYANGLLISEELGNVDFVTGAYTKSLKRDYSLHVVAGNSTNNTPEFKLYPNPACDFVTVELPETSSEDLEIKILDLNGRFIYQAPKPEIMASGNRYIFLVSGMPKGFYMVQLKSKEHFMKQKLLVR